MVGELDLELDGGENPPDREDPTVLDEKRIGHRRRTGKKTVGKEKEKIPPDDMKAGGCWCFGEGGMTVQTRCSLARVQTIVRGKDVPHGV